MEKLVLTSNMLNTTRQAIIDGLVVAGGSKSSATYYHSSEEQLKAIRNQINGLYFISKELPLVIANQKGVTGRFISEVLFNEFRNTSTGGANNIINPMVWHDEGLGDMMVSYALYNLHTENGLPYVLRFFGELKERRINNNRTKRYILNFVWSQSNLEFYALKYRSKIADALKHAYGVKRTSILLSIAKKFSTMENYIPTVKENGILNVSLKRYFNSDVEKAMKLLLFIFKDDVGVEYSSDVFPLISEYQKARTDIVGVSKVPEEVLIGLISDVKHPQYHLMWGNSEQRESTKKLIREAVKVTSINQQVRQTKSTEKLGAQKEVNLSKATDFLALYKTGYENGFTDEINNAIEVLASRKAIDGFMYQNIGIILDDSNSMRGHSVESKNTPRAIADFTAKVLQKSANDSVLIKTDSMHSDLGTPFVSLIESESVNDKYDAIFVLTDGYENGYDGMFNEMVKIYRKETNSTIPIFQISPITGAEMGGNVRSIGTNLITMAINKPEAMITQMNARMLEIDVKRWLELQIKAIEDKNVKY